MYLLYIKVTENQEKKSTSKSTTVQNTTVQSTTTQICDLLVSCQFTYWFSDVNGLVAISPQFFKDPQFGPSPNLMTFRSTYGFNSICRVLEEMVQWVKKEINLENLDLCIIPFHNPSFSMISEQSLFSTAKNKKIVVLNPQKNMITLKKKSTTPCIQKKHLEEV